MNAAKTTAAECAREQGKIHILKVAHRIYHVQPLGPGILKSAVVEAASAQEAAAIYKNNRKHLQ